MLVLNFKVNFRIFERTQVNRIGFFNRFNNQLWLLKMDLHERISINPKVCHGEPCIKGTRIVVTNILAAIAEGLPMSEILEDFPGIRMEDVLACVAFAPDVVQEKEWYPAPATNPSWHDEIFGRPKHSISCRSRAQKMRQVGMKLVQEYPVPRGGICQALALVRGLDLSLTLTAWQKALKKNKPEIHHSDQGIQYSAPAYTQALVDAGVQISMAEAGARTKWFCQARHANPERASICRTIKTIATPIDKSGVSSTMFTTPNAFTRR
jgi:uncharacterized protein (DUF433 family)